MTQQQLTQLTQWLATNVFRNGDIMYSLYVDDVCCTTVKIGEAIKLLKNKEPHILEQLTLAQQKVMKIMRDEPNEAYVTYRGGFVEGLDLAIKLTREAINNG